MHISTYVQSYMVTCPPHLAIESSGLHLGVHRESTSASAYGYLMEHGDDLLERVQSQSRLAVEMGAGCTCHRLRMQLILVFDATSYSRRSPDFQSLKTKQFLLARSRSRIILHIHVRPVRKQDAGPHVPCELLQVDVEAMIIKECLVVVIEQLEVIGTLFVFNKCGRELCFIRCDLKSQIMDDRTDMQQVRRMTDYLDSFAH